MLREGLDKEREKSQIRSAQCIFRRIYYGSWGRVILATHGMKFLFTLEISFYIGHLTYFWLLFMSILLPCIFYPYCAMLFLYLHLIVGVCDLHVFNIYYSTNVSNSGFKDPNLNILIL